MGTPLVLVTGATDGIGRETALELARRGADVIIHGRSAAKVAAVVDAVAAAAGRPAPSPLVGDLASLVAVRALASTFMARGQALDVLIHNAGVFMQRRELSADGHELTFAVNHLAPFLLTHLLLDALRAAPAARIVHVSSIAHARGRIDFDDLDAERRFDGYGAYAASKLMNVLFSNELARRLSTTTITSNALHPGVVSTKLLKTGFGMAGPDSHGEGAATSVHLALSPAVAGVTGRYFARSSEAQPASQALHLETARRLYEVSCALTGATPL